MVCDEDLELLLDIVGSPPTLSQRRAYLSYFLFKVCSKYILPENVANPFVTRVSRENII